MKTPEEYDCSPSLTHNLGPFRGVSHSLPDPATELARTTTNIYFSYTTCLHFWKTLYWRLDIFPSFLQVPWNICNGWEVLLQHLPSLFLQGSPWQNITVSMAQSHHWFIKQHLGTITRSLIHSGHSLILSSTCQRASTGLPALFQLAPDFTKTSLSFVVSDDWWYLFPWTFWWVVV